MSQEGDQERKREMGIRAKKSEQVEIEAAVGR